ncbi:hypothetical protein [Herbaspirillum sp.]|uniref:hypothetical protein n=1 Tax=Herbaspirillum sp. TaxID=1890675 RepID=UPI002D782C06|nr:hypothetical protein [Herbaspirillum sp.]
MFLYLPFLLVFLTVLVIGLGWRSLSNKLWLASVGVALWWLNHYTQGNLGLVL